MNFMPSSMRRLKDYNFNLQPWRSKKVQEIKRMTEDEDRPLKAQSPMIPPTSIDHINNLLEKGIAWLKWKNITNSFKEFNKGEEAQFFLIFVISTL